MRELRASSKVVQQALADLQNIGLVSARDDQSFVYRPASPQLDELAGAAELLYRTKPVSVINAIALAPNEKLRIFADAFRLKE
ncbi:MAG: hypothetical protein KGJ78_12450 [Alphaproteobacteria bacterium]|nr:hypothetical protein [Alphaproteobacteria bacterium]